MAIAEGIETALAYSLHTGLGCWAATNATLLAQWKPPENCREVVIAADNDSSFAGQHAAYQLAYRLHAKGYRVEVDMPFTADVDWCDVIALRNYGKGLAP